MMVPDEMKNRDQGEKSELNTIIGIIVTIYNHLRKYVPPSHIS